MNRIPRLIVAAILAFSLLGERAALAQPRVPAPVPVPAPPVVIRLPITTPVPVVIRLPITTPGPVVIRLPITTPALPPPEIERAWTLVKEQPAETLRILSQFPPLAGAERQLTIEALARLAQSGELNEMLRTVQRVRLRWPRSEKFNEYVSRALELLQTTCERRVLKELARTLEAKDWPNASKRSQELLENESLGEGLQRVVRDLHKTAELLDAFASKPIQLDVSRLKENIRNLQQSGLIGSDLAANSQLDLASNSFLEGEYTGARRLLPERVPQQHAEAALRDMKALVLGEGSVATWPGRKALHSETPAAGEPPVRGPPPGIEHLLPPEAKRDWGAGIHEKRAGEGLPPLEEPVNQLKQVETTQRERAQETVRAELARLGREKTKLMEDFRRKSEPYVHLSDGDDDECNTVIDEVEARLVRDAKKSLLIAGLLRLKLSPMEQGSLSALWRQGKSTSDLCQSVYRLRLNRLPYESHQYAYGLKFEPSKVRHHSNTNDNIDDEVVETIENWLLTESQLIEALEVHRLARLSTIERVLVCEMHRQGKSTNEVAKFILDFRLEVTGRTVSIKGGEFSITHGTGKL